MKTWEVLSMVALAAAMTALAVITWRTDRERIAEYRRSNELEAARLQLLADETRKDWHKPRSKVDREAVQRLLETGS